MAEKQPSSLATQVVTSPFGLLAGATYPFRALALLLRNPGMWGYVLIPILLNLLVGIALYFGALVPGWQWIDSWVMRLPEWLVAIEWLLRIVLGGLLLLLLGIVLLQFGAILGSPWYGMLAERLEKQRLGATALPASGGLASAFQDIGRALMFELKKLFFAIAVGACLFLLGWLPVAGTAVVSIGGLSLAATLVCLDCLDACLGRRRLGFRTKLGWVVRSFPASASFAVVCWFLVSIPLLNLVTIPICVAAGTLFFCDRIWPKFANTPALNSHTDSSQ